jgi:hypothetical protein
MHLESERGFMPFRKGREKTGGRRKGSINCDRWIARQILAECLGGMSIPARLLALTQNDPLAEVDVLQSLMPFCHPRIASIELEISSEVSDQRKSAEVAILSQKLTELTNMKIYEEVERSLLKAGATSDVTAIILSGLNITAPLV